MLHTGSRPYQRQKEPQDYNPALLKQCFDASESTNCVQIEPLEDEPENPLTDQDICNESKVTEEDMAFEIDESKEKLFDEIDQNNGKYPCKIGVIKEKLPNEIDVNKDKLSIGIDDNKENHFNENDMMVKIPKSHVFNPFYHEENLGNQESVLQDHEQHEMDNTDEDATDANELNDKEKSNDEKMNFLKCPLETCKTIVSAQAFKSGQAAKHMITVHKIRVCKMMELGLKWKIVTQKDTLNVDEEKTTEATTDEVRESHAAVTDYKFLTEEKILKFKEKLLKLRNENVPKEV
eukprot:TRINITY_DN19058_c0_g1_i5.p1 TRINITY_DN19058_c0_g1~~TRINITY_DN19058_c0_g1_i5.p1  ORF type:complete len:308 (-),score=75.72 TRINITY_DN19058_c0_g1_i5:120-995(-)